MDANTLLKTVHFDFPSYIPVIFHINLACWDHYDRQVLADLVRLHPHLFPSGVPDFVVQHKEVPYEEWCDSRHLWTDPWVCVWQTTMSGFVGTVVHHPIENLASIDTYSAPDPDKTTHWYPVTWKKGESPTGGSIGFFDCLPSGEIGHGHTFLKLIDILGYEKAIYALYDEPKELHTLLDMITEFNLGLVERFIEYADVKWMGYAEDLGMQIGPMLSPDLFARHILPAYERIMRPAAEHGCIIHMHSDGDVRDLMPLLRTLPINVFNIQDTVNTVDWIAQNLKGKVAIDLDIDRQNITQQDDANKARAYLSEVMQKMYDPAGGLIITYGLYPGTPVNIIGMMMDFFEDIVTGGKPWLTTV